MILFQKNIRLEIKQILKVLREFILKPVAKSTHEQRMENKIQSLFQYEVNIRNQLSHNLPQVMEDYYENNYQTLVQQLKGVLASRILNEQLDSENLRVYLRNFLQKQFSQYRHDEDFFEDVIQESISNVYKNVVEGKYMGNSTMYYYAKKVCFYTALHEHKKRTQSLDLIEKMEMASWTNLSEEDEPFEKFNQKHEETHLKKIFLILSPYERLLLYLNSEQDKKSLRELAEMLGISHQTIKRQIDLAREKIREEWKRSSGC